MSDNTNSTNSTENTNETPAPENEVDKWKNLSRQNETAKKEALTERDALQEQLNTVSGELHTLREQLESAQAESQSEKLLRTRSEVARAYRLEDDVLEFLTGTDEDTLTAQAKKLQILSSTKKEDPNSHTFVIGSEGQGATPLNSPEITDFLKGQFGY